MGVVNLFQLFEDRHSEINKLYQKTVALDIASTIFKAGKAHPVNSIQFQSVIFNQIFNLKIACKDVIVVFDGKFIPPKKRHIGSPQKKGSQNFSDPIFERMTMDEHRQECSNGSSFKYGCRRSYEERKNIPGIDYTIKILHILNIVYFFNCSDGEVACSHLNKHGIVDIVCSEDADNLFLGAKNIMRMYQTLKTGGRYADRKFSYECVTPNLSQNELPTVFLVWVLIQGGDFHDGIDDVGFKSIQKLFKSPKFVEISKKLEKLKPDGSFDEGYSEWVSEIKKFFAEYINDKDNKVGVEAHAGLIRVGKNIAKSNSFPDANQAIKYIFPLSVNVNEIQKWVNTSANESCLYDNVENMKFFLHIFPKEVLLSLGVIREMKKQVLEKSPEEWTKNFKIVKEYASEDGLPAGYQIKYKNFFIPKLIEEDLRLEPDHPRGRRHLPPLNDSAMYFSLQEAAKNKKTRESQCYSDEDMKGKVRDTAEYPYSITLTKDRVWDELWDLVTEWDMKIDYEREIKKSSPRKKRKPNIIESPTKPLRNYSLLDMPNSPVKLTRKSEQIMKTTSLPFDLSDDSDIIEFKMNETDVIDLTIQSDSLVLMHKKSSNEEIILSSD